MLLFDLVLAAPTVAMTSSIDIWWFEAWLAVFVVGIAGRVGSSVRWRVEVGPEGLTQVRWRTSRWSWAEIGGIWTGEEACDLIVAPIGQRARRVWIFERVRDAADAQLVETVAAHATPFGVPVAPLPFYLPRTWPLDRLRLRRLTT